MDAQFKAKWVEALRSGKFEQAQSSLRETSGGFCCLGVLANQFADEWRSQTNGGCRMVPVRAGKPLSAGGLTDDAMSGYLSSSFSDEVGLNDEMQRKVAKMNDNGKSFAEIADYIEANL